ncbi:hypothetical protein SAMN04488005_0135 [Yoonia tamlensis]|uniref:Uncharacterized protein n=1 Tax=Yoonia tamlensis TaxID=390270 RepID=A0A1I6FNZ9_9RHOB|nr:hypothetical protein [Yoonia tamlensis]SFR31665.1 hypothetical protein SAMN04488005_0135 [Yoonia tamlensis]
MQVSQFGFYGLYWGVPFLVAVMAVLIALKFSNKKARGLLIVAGFLAASGYYFWFELTVRYEALTVFTAESCDQGRVRYHLPFGEGVSVKIDNTLDGAARTVGYYAGLTAVSNQTDHDLLISEVIYTHEGVPARRRADLDGYVIAAGETHALKIHDSDMYFLEPLPETFRVTTTGFELSKYAVRCNEPIDGQ